MVGEAADGGEVLAAVAGYAPGRGADGHPDARGGRAGRHRGAARRCRDPPEVIVLTTFDADEYVLRALRAGASGFLLKDTPPAEIVQAVRGWRPARRCCPRR